MRGVLSYMKLLYMLLLGSESPGVHLLWSSAPSSSANLRFVLVSVTAVTLISRPYFGINGAPLI